MKYDPYPHQVKVIEELRSGIREGHSRQVLAMATGAGKTVVAGQMALNAAENGKRALFIVHMKQLVIQAVEHFEAIGLKVGIIQGENTDFSIDNDIIVASIQTIRSRKDNFAEGQVLDPNKWVDFVIIDECHIFHDQHVELVTEWSETPFIGLSATPMRKDLGQYFSNLVRGPTVQWLTDNEYLVPAKAFCPGSEHMSEILSGIQCKNTPHGYDYNEKALGEAMNQTELVGDIVETWQQSGEDRQTLCFAVNVAHSKSIADDFVAAGVAAAHIDHKTPDDERRELIGKFRRKEIRILSSVGVLSIGFDVPDASCLILARPTKSEMLDMQQKGRGIRRAKGKENCIILDHAGNCLNHGLPVHFEVPDLQDKDRTASSGSRRKEKKMVACSECGFALEPDQFVCPACGIDRPKPSPKVRYRDGRLVEYGSLDDGDEVWDLADCKNLYRQLLWYVREKNHKEGWAYYKLLERTGYKAPKRWLWLDPILPSQFTMRWIAREKKAYALRMSYAKRSAR